MHVLMVIGGGVVLLGLFILFGWLWGASSAGMAMGAKAFVPVWLLIAAGRRRCLKFPMSMWPMALYYKWCRPAMPLASGFCAPPWWVCPKAGQKPQPRPAANRQTDGAGGLFRAATTYC